MGRVKENCENCLFGNNCAHKGKKKCKHWKSMRDLKFEPYYANKFKKEWDTARFKLRRYAGLM